MIKITVVASSSAGNCYQVDDGATRLLIECGLLVSKIKKGLDFKLWAVKGCLVSHGHKDHSCSVGALAKIGIPSYMTPGTLFEIKKEASPLLRKIKIGECRKIGTWRITPVPIKHDAIEPCGFVLDNQAGERCVYITDTSQLLCRVPGATHVMVECNFVERNLDYNVSAGMISQSMARRLRKYHMSLETLKDKFSMIVSQATREIILLHLSDRNSDADKILSSIKTMAKHANVYIAQK